MKIENVQPEMWEKIEALNRFDYRLPNISEFCAGKMVQSEGNPVVVVLARPTVELYLLSDPEWESPAQRFNALRLIHDEMAAELKKLGYNDAEMWIPPEVSNFSKRLVRSFGWSKMRPKWTCLARQI